MVDNQVPTGDPRQNELRVEFGKIVLSFMGASDRLRLEASERYAPFVSEEPPDLALQVRCEPLPDVELGEALFESGGNWSLHQVDGMRVIRIRAWGFDPLQLIVLDDELRRGQLYCDDEAWPDCTTSPVGYPIEEALTINLLAQGRGVLLHSSGVIDGGQGILFNGVSGSGKSTMASLWEAEDGTTVLSDDRVIVREQDGRFWGYGTPWHGDARILSPEAAPLERIFVIHHAKENQVAKLKPMEAVSRLLVASFPPFWDAEGMAFTLDLLKRLVENVPCYQLGFAPDEDVVELVRCVR
jgi:hypothetical protein